MKKFLAISALAMVLAGCSSAIYSTQPDIQGYSAKSMEGYLSCVVDKYTPSGFSLSQVTIDGGYSLRLANGVIILNVIRSGSGVKYQLYKTHAPIELYPKIIDSVPVDCE